MVEANGYLNIGTYSLITKLSPKALRLYEGKGLLVPAKREYTLSRSTCSVCSGSRWR